MTSRRNKLAAVACAAAAVVLGSACTPEQAAPDLKLSENARQCIIDHESRYDGIYAAEHGGNSGGRSTASGAYQFLDATWQLTLPRAEKYYGLDLTSIEEEMPQDARGNTARTHAAYASPYAQDLVTAFALLHRQLNQNHRPWTGIDAPCYKLLGQAPNYRPDTPPNAPPAFIQEQIDAYSERSSTG